MNRSVRSLLPVILAFACTTGNAQQPSSMEDRTSWTLGVRAWHASFSSWDVIKGTQACGVLGISPCPVPDQAGNIEPENRPMVLIPSVAIRRGSWLLSGAYSLAPTYRFSVLDQTVTNRRREADLNLGYFLTPSAVLTLGYKQMHQEVDGGKTVYRGPTIGLSGSARISDRLSMYANTAFGLPGYFDGNVGPETADSTGREKFSVSYSVIEVGLAIPLAVDVWPGSRPIVLTAGYRTQSAKIKNYRLAVDPSARLSITTNLSDVTQGFVLGISTTF
ncbi:MAG: hypothetical protein RJA10_1327 [Pseudomonadota bacterium]|jgi:hypothetical protein